MFFVVTSGRSGSQTIADALTQSPDCICLHEPEPVFVKEATLYQYGLMSDEMMRAVLLSTRSPTLQGKTYGESNQKLSFLIPVLSAVFPESKFIWLVRDGRDVVASTYYGRRWYKSVSEIADERRKPYTTELKEWAWYRLRGDLTGDMITSEWEALSRFGKNCWLWARTNGIIESHLAKLPGDRWRLARLETLFEQIPELCRFLGVTVPATVEAVRRNASATAPTPWEEWADDQQAAFEKWCGGAMNRLYPEWRQVDSRLRRAARATESPLAASGPWWRRIRLMGGSKR